MVGAQSWFTEQEMNPNLDSRHIHTMPHMCTLYGIEEHMRDEVFSLNTFDLGDDIWLQSQVSAWVTSVTPFSLFVWTKQGIEKLVVAREKTVIYFRVTLGMSFMCFCQHSVSRNRWISFHINLPWSIKFLKCPLMVFEIGMNLLPLPAGHTSWWRPTVRD